MRDVDVQLRDYWEDILAETAPLSAERFIDPTWAPVESNVLHGDEALHDEEVVEVDITVDYPSARSSDMRNKVLVRTVFAMAAAVALVVGFVVIYDNSTGVTNTADSPTSTERETPRVVLSPLVDIASRLTAQADVELFTVEANRPDYWRVTSLDVFDGRVWRSRGSFDRVDGSLETELPSGARFEELAQRFVITGSTGLWLPAAHEPTDLFDMSPGWEIEYGAQSGTLIASPDQTNGLEYSLLSMVPVREVDVLESASADVPRAIADRYLDLPDDFSPRIVRLAEDIVAGAESSPFQKALTLQNYFRDPTLFQYSVDVSRGHSSDRIEDFLFESRVGYSEQFAGAYAAMARAVDLPARVAVGFTPGEYDPDMDSYRVSGRHAHSWPEVWIDGAGWVRFEPTPGRGAPGDEEYTGQAVAQASDQS